VLIGVSYYCASRNGPSRTQGVLAHTFVCGLRAPRPHITGVLHICRALCVVVGSEARVDGSSVMLFKLVGRGARGFGVEGRRKRLRRGGHVPRGRGRVGRNRLNRRALGIDDQ